MDSSFGPFDAFAFVVMGALVLTFVVVVVNLGRLPGLLARKWAHPQASAINAMSWIGIATGGLLWPIAFVWAFTVPMRGESAAIKDARELHGGDRADGVATPTPALRLTSGDEEPQS
ncbi:MAG: DUF3302 domain-containing protein [Roseiarcus sp.]|jgi:hypothetical protein